MKRTVPMILGGALVLALLALGLAWGVNRGVASFVFVVPEDADLQAPEGRPAPAGTPSPEPVAAARTPQPRGLNRSQYVDGIMRRNLFDHEAIAKWNPTPEGEDDEDQTPISDLNITLIGTAIAQPATASQALMVTDQPNATPRGYTIGSDIFGAKVVAIEPKRVTIRRNGNLEYITMDDSAPQTASRGYSRSTDDSDEDVQEVGDNKFVVDQSLIDRYINDLEAISRMGRALLHRGPDGQFDGYRMSAIRRDSLPDQLGIKNGDIIHSVNGMDLNSVQGAMNAYNTLQNEKAFEFEVTRRGQKVTMQYEVQ